MVDFVVVVMRMVVVIEVEMMFGIGMPMADKIVRYGIWMGTRKELRIDVMRPLRKKRSRASFCTLVTGKNVLEHNM